MKQIPVKKKKLQKQSTQDTISETISFVIKGKLTPIKPRYVSKKVPLDKKLFKVKKTKAEKQKSHKIKPEDDCDSKKSVKTKESKATNKKTATAPRKTEPSPPPQSESPIKKIECNLNIKTTVNKPKPKADEVKKSNAESKAKSNAETKTKSLAETKAKLSAETKAKLSAEAKAKLSAEAKAKTKLSVETKTKLSAKEKFPKSEEKVRKLQKRDTCTNDTAKAIDGGKNVIKSDSVEPDDLKSKETIQKLLRQANKAIKQPPKVSKKKPTLAKAKTKKLLKKFTPTKIKLENPEDSLEDEEVLEAKTSAKKSKVKQEPPPEEKLPEKAKKLPIKAKKVVKRLEDGRARKLKLYGFWNGPKRHRVASLNALAKVHCLYENEGRNNFLDGVEGATKMDEQPESPPRRILRSVPGLRAVGKHWDMHDASSTSSEDTSCDEEERKPLTKAKPEQEEQKKPEIKRKRNRDKVTMDLKDMVVRKRMASLNATAILAASYSQEKRSSKQKNDETDTSESSDFTVTDDEEKKSDVKQEDKLIEVTTPNKKVAVILNQDTDVTITGVYVNSTTRSTHHEGYCSIAGMQYRISATSHTQTAATAVATETLLQSTSNTAQENTNCESLNSPCKSYAPLDALSNMQPPANGSIQHGVPQQMGPPQHVIGMPTHQISPGRRHGCSSAFTAPHSSPYHGPPPPGHHSGPHPGPSQTGEPPATYIHGYYQPAGPLITVPHGHTQPPLVKSAPLSESSHTSSSPVSHGPHPTPTSNNGDSSDNEVQITSVTAGKDVPVAPPSNYRYSQYTPGPPPPHGYSYPYPSHYYHSPAPPTPTYPHHDICYSPSPYLHHKYPPSAYRRYLPTAQYYPPNPGEMYTAPPSGPPPPSSQQVVTATPVSVSNGTTYSPPTVPPQPLIETYPPMVEAYPHPPPHFYPGYTPGPPPACYTHQPPSRAMNFINATYQSCPCPMQSCPKNGLTGPLTGDSKRSNILSKDSMPLPPVALALPLEPASATGPPSPARGSAGMPPPPSPAGATYQPPPTKQESVSPEAIPEEKKRKARVGKAMVRNNIQNTMLLMCNPPNVVKREIESPKDKEVTPEPPKEDTPDVEPKLPPPVQMELKVTIESNPVKLEEKEDAPLEPIVSTVAENVKVKNMKRKLSMTQEVPVSPKKSKTDAKANGSYKDLIKKDSTAVKINNGKRKLIVDSKLPLTRTPKIRCKKPATKRKLSLVKEDAASKKLKLIPPNNNTQDEAVKKVNSKVNCTKKSAPALLDNLIARNTIDRTIECVISGTVRTTTSDKCKTTKEPKNAPKTLKEQEPVVPTLLKRKTPVTSILPATKKKEPPKKTTVLPPAPKKKEAAAAAAAVPKKSINAKVAPAPVMAKKSARINENRRKSKSREVMQSIPKVPRRSLVAPRWSNGWNWDGEAYEAKVFLNSDETTVVRRCYPAMRHDEGDIIEVRDCVLLKAGPRKNDLPFVAKIAALWENPEDGEMMMSLLWYYRPEHTEQGRLASDQPDEVFASRHKDSNSVACIDDKCYVLTFNEYCRYRKELRRLEEGIEETSPCIPNPEPYPRSHRQPPHQQQISSEMIFFCRKVYDFRQKRIVKNPT